MSIKNSYISVKSSSESELVQALLFEAGAGWVHGGRSTLPISSCIIMINDSLEMFYDEVVNPLVDFKELSVDELVEIVRPDASEVNNSYYVCKFSDNHISFKDSEVDFTIDELSELLQVIRSLSHRDFEITTSDDTDDQVFSLTNLTIHFK